MYTLKGQSANTLTNEQAEELLAQAELKLKPHVSQKCHSLKVPRGKALLKQITPLEIEQLFADLPTDHEVAPLPPAHPSTFHWTVLRISRGLVM